MIKNDNLSNNLPVTPEERGKQDEHCEEFKSTYKHKETTPPFSGIW